MSDSCLRDNANAVHVDEVTATMSDKHVEVSTQGKTWMANRRFLSTVGSRTFVSLHSRDRRLCSFLGFEKLGTSTGLSKLKELRTQQSAAATCHGLFGDSMNALAAVGGNSKPKRQRMTRDEQKKRWSHAEGAPIEITVPAFGAVESTTVAVLPSVRSHESLVMEAEPKAVATVLGYLIQAGAVARPAKAKRSPTKADADSQGLDSQGLGLSMEGDAVDDDTSAVDHVAPGGETSDETTNTMDAVAPMQSKLSNSIHNVCSNKRRSSNPRWRRS